MTSPTSVRDPRIFEELWKARNVVLRNTKSKRKDQIPSKALDETYLFRNVLELTFQNLSKFESGDFQFLADRGKRVAKRARSLAGFLC